MNLARWLRRTPVPHAIVCGDKRIAIGDGHRRWADCVDAIFATDSETINAVSKDGTTLRVCSRGDIDDAPEPDATAAYTDRQQELAQLAQIIADAYSVAHEHARDNSASGYALLAKFAEMSFQRLNAIETAYGKLLTAHARLIEAQASSGGGDVENAMGGLIEHVLGGSKRSNGKSEPAKPEAPKE
jgi:hypothetical protein